MHRQVQCRLQYGISFLCSADSNMIYRYFSAICRLQHSISFLNTADSNIVSYTNKHQSSDGKLLWSGKSQNYHCNMKNDDFNIFQYLHWLMIAAFCIAATLEMFVIILIYEGRFLCS